MGGDWDYRQPSDEALASSVWIEFFWRAPWANNAFTVGRIQVVSAAPEGSGSGTKFKLDWN